MYGVRKCSSFILLQVVGQFPQYHLLKRLSFLYCIFLPLLSNIRCPLLLGRKVMTNLDSIFKSRDITLPTKVHVVKAMVFPVVMYGCES